MMQESSEQARQTVEYVLSGLLRQRTSIQEQIMEQALGRAMLPNGVLDGLRRAYDLMLKDLLKEESDLNLAIAVLEKGGPNCVRTAFEILAAPANLLEHVCLNELGTELAILH